MIVKFADISFVM